MFSKATKKKSKLRLLLEGASGSGKTWSSLMMASVFGKKVAVIDTEKGSASLYSGSFDFDVCELAPPYTPEKYIQAISFAEKEGYEVIIIDSITHEWSGEGGCLDIHSNIKGQNSYTDWRKVTPRHNAFLETLLKSKCHIIATARTKADVVLQDKINKSGKTVKTPVKLGTKTEQRDGLDYEFTTVLRLSNTHCFEALKDRTGIFDNREGEVLAKGHSEEIINWLNSGAETPKQLPLQKEVDMLQGCKNLEQLKSIFSSFDKSTKKALEDVKDEMKRRLTPLKVEMMEEESKGFDFEGKVA
tara:strand:+ start:1652 stop:2554 length:903 start_codon:yes stop_codon:yes gene_type:complete